MTREDKLYSMRMVDLVTVAEKLGIKINRKSAKSEAIEKILAAEEVDKVVKDDHVAEVIEQKKELDANHNASDSMIDPAVFAKFVKKAQRLITQASHDENGYDITINVNGKDINYHDKNLQNIRSSIGHIYRGEVTI